MRRTLFVLLILVVMLITIPATQAPIRRAESSTHRTYLPLAARRGASPPVPAAAVATVLNTIRTRFQAMPEPNDTAARAELAGVISTLPHIVDAGVATEDHSVWAYFSDGRMLTIPVTVPDLSDAARTSTSRSLRSGSPPAQGLPAGDTAYLLDALGTCFRHGLTHVTPWMTANHYAVAPIQPTVQQLKTVHDAAVAVFDTHGGAVNGLNGSTYALWTLSQWSLANDLEFLGDLLNGQLVYMLAHEDIATSGQNCTSEWHYGITAAFVSQHMTFAPRSFVFFNGCSSMSPAAQPMRTAFASKGASRYAGWTAPVDDYDSYLADLAIFDLMLAANTGGTGTQPLRPFDLDVVFAYLQYEGLDLSGYECGPSHWICPSWLRLAALVSDPTQQFNLLTPTILRAGTRKGTYGTSEPPMVLHIYGQFGSQPGQVTVGGHELTVHTWMPTYILAALPAHGPGSTGDIVVKVRDHRSNPVPLSEWRGHFEWRVDYSTYVVPAEGLYAEVDCQLQLRADYHAFRLTPGDDPQVVETETTGGQDSRCTWEMHGDVTWTSLGDEYRGVLTGAGVITWRDGQGPPGPFVSPGGIMQPAQHTLAFGASVGGVYGNLDIYRNGVYQNTDQVSLLGTGIITASLTTNGSIVSGTGIYDWPLGRSTTHWDSIPVRYPPTATTPG